MAPSALQISLAVPDAINPATPLLPADYRLPTPEDLLDGGGSKNIPKLRACNQAAQQRTRNQGLFNGVMDAARDYAEHYSLHSTEVGSRFVYGDWNTWSDLVLAALAREAGRTDTSEALLRPMRGQLILETLGASWRLDGGPRWPGRTPTICGARSYTVDKDAAPNPGSYWDSQGRYKAPYAATIGRDNQQGNAVSTALGERQGAGQLGDADQACRVHLGTGLYDWVTAEERAHLRRLADLGGNGGLTVADQDALAWAVGAFNDDEATTPAVPMVFIVTDQCKATLCEKWIGSGSTSMMYGFVWYVAQRPSIPLLDGINWWSQDDRCAWLTAGEPRRTIDTSGIGQWDQERGVIRCQQNTGGGRYYDVASMSYRSGWAEIPVPGTVLLAVRIDSDGAEVIAGDGIEPPPQQGPKARMRRRKIGPRPGGLTRFSLKNTSLRSDGGPRDLLEIDGEPRGALKVGSTRYFDLPPGLHVARLTAREGDLVDRCKRKMKAP